MKPHMHRILAKQQLAPDVFKITYDAPRIAAKRQPGQFVIVRQGADCERIPLTIADVNKSEGSITLVIKAIGLSTRGLCSLEAGDSITDIAGPLGHPTEIITKGRAVLVGGGVGTAVIWPIATALRENNVDVISITGGRSAEWVILADELAECGRVILCTDDGSLGTKGFVTQALKDVLDEGNIDIVYTAGPMPMMRAISELTRPYGVKTMVSLNPVMVDGTGMCGGCRVVVDNKVKFACVDGPEFDGHLVDFDEIQDRLSAYREMEKQAEEYHRCRIGLDK